MHFHVKLHNVILIVLDILQHICYHNAPTHSERTVLNRIDDCPEECMAAGENTVEELVPLVSTPSPPSPSSQ